MIYTSPAISLAETGRWFSKLNWGLSMQSIFGFLLNVTPITPEANPYLEQYAAQKITNLHPRFQTEYFADEATVKCSPNHRYTPTRLLRDRQQNYQSSMPQPESSEDWCTIMWVDHVRRCWWVPSQNRKPLTTHPMIPLHHPPSFPSQRRYITSLFPVVHQAVIFQHLRFFPYIERTAAVL